MRLNETFAISSVSCAALLFAQIAIAQTSRTDPPSRWRTYASKAGRFSVDLPGTPEEKDGCMILGTHLNGGQLKANRDMIGYIIMYIDPPTAVHPGLHGADEEQRLTRVARGLKHDFFGLCPLQVLSEKKLSVGKHPGMEIRTKATLKITFGKLELTSFAFLADFRVYVAGDREFILIGMRPTLMDNFPQETERFFNSFKPAD